ncbi:MAG: hypothetical protein D6746_10840 [Bacteroidetes bacterium]|nr:MAG: hypothetical protein D6746_10840 [Bacteroidota bacterium]
MEEMTLIAKHDHILIPVKDLDGIEVDGEVLWRDDRAIKYGGMVRVRGLRVRPFVYKHRHQLRKVFDGKAWMTPMSVL